VTDVPMGEESTMNVCTPHRTLTTPALLALTGISLPGAQT
jgi:hypothetical protein